MQQTRLKGFRGGGNFRMQSALQLLLSRVQFSISNATSVTHLSGKSMRDLEQITHRGPLLTADDLVSPWTVAAHILHVFSIRCIAGVRRRHRKPPWHNQRQRVPCKYFV